MGGKNQDFLILIDTRLKRQSLKEVKDKWKGHVYGAINEAPHSSGGIIILARQGMDTVPLENGQDSQNKGRVAWGIYDTRGNKTLIIGVYGPLRGDEAANSKFFEEGVSKYWTKPPISR